MSNSDNAAFIRKIEHLYNSEEGELWEMIMGRFIHTGGWYSSQRLASAAGIKPHMIGADLASNSGEAGRFLVRNRGVKKMTCVDLARTAVERGIERSRTEGFGKEQISHIQADVTRGLPMFKDNSLDFVWGEDAWAHIPDKGALVRSMHRIIKPGGLIAFTDWIYGETPMTKQENDEWLKLMTTPNHETVQGYANLMIDAGFKVLRAEDTGIFVPTTKLYIAMLEKQFKGDALRILKNNTNAYEETMRFFYFLLDLAEKGKLTQGMFVGRKPGKVVAKSKL